jgi:hypothetical protein
VVNRLKKNSGPNEASPVLNDHRGRATPVAVLLIFVVLLSMGSGIYASASYFAPQASNVTVTTTIYTTTTSWTTSTIWSTVTSVVYGVWTTVQYTTSTSTVTVGGGDSYTKLLLPMDGTSGSKTFLDTSPQSHSITANGNVQIDTSQYVFGGASGKFDGTNSYLSTPRSADWAFGTGNFTIDFWVRFNSLPSNGAFMFVYSQYVNGVNQNLFGLYNSGGSYQWWFIDDLSGSRLISIEENTAIRTGVWYHIALVRSGNNWMIFQNGTQVGTTVVNSNAVTDQAAPLLIGTYNGSSGWLNGWLDEYRVSKGIARWTSNFTPPTAPY